MSLVKQIILASAISATLNLQQGRASGSKRGFPKLIRVHFAQAFVGAAGTGLSHPLRGWPQAGPRTVDELAAVLCVPVWRFGHRRLQMLLLKPPERFAFAGAEHAAIKVRDFFTRAGITGETDAVVLAWIRPCQRRSHSSARGSDRTGDLFGQPCKSGIDRAWKQSTGMAACSRIMTG